MVTKEQVLENFQASSGDKRVTQFSVSVWNSGPAHMVVTGEAGSGKSALLANWLHHKKQETKQLVLYHFVGCAEDTSGTASICQPFLGLGPRAQRLCDRPLASMMELPRPKLSTVDKKLFSEPARNSNCGKTLSYPE